MADEKAAYSATDSSPPPSYVPHDAEAGRKVPRSSVDDLPADVEAGQNSGLERTLSARHLVFLAIGGCVGTGVFLSTGPALNKSGPASLLIAYAFVGLVTYSVMMSLGELAAFMPVAGCFTTYASRLISPSAGFATGWIYFLSWAVTYGLELTAAGLVLQYWLPNLNIGVWIAVFWVLLTAANFMPVRWIGEFEMWFSSIKVVTILGFFLFGICINAGASPQGYLGFKYWDNPGAFAAYKLEGSRGQAVGFFSALITATFSFLGSELVVMGAGEAANPRKAIPKAIHWTFWTIFSLFLATILLIGLTVPSNHPSLDSEDTNASASPLVIAAQLAGVGVLTHIINAVLLTAVLTAACSNVYSSSRILVGLSEEGHAPAFFRTTNRIATPYWSVLFSACFGLLGFLNLSSNGKQAFTWLLNLNTVAGIIAWSVISLCHIRFRDALAIQGLTTQELPYVAPFQPWLSWFGLIFTAAIALTSGFTVFIQWDTAEFFTAYISVIFFVVTYFVHWLIYRKGLVNLSDVELRSWQRAI
ncbi:hypothetical protein HIM_04122 [Hirsutella minnesotensis 3608]|uniref:Amino acid permease/ SLC12A domain-containing protein n=1 Tax=Hirsutella minnesotensis 3608 TaxID=1043627 RepID=A0A0F7ZVC9_9HYPO|nr:hypothetical protein HIM_04122 [Hirsutella minnesotensis 3608]